LFVAGECYPCSQRLARLLTERSEARDEDWSSLATTDLDVLTALVNDGHFVIVRSR